MQATRARVLRAVAELDYEPDPSARNLRSNTTFVIGLVYDNPNPYHIIGVQNGVLSACRETGFGLQIHPCDSTSPMLAEELADWVQRSRLAGLVLTAPMSERPELVAALNDLFERVAGLLEAERRFTADAAHELRTPLAALQAQLQVALRARDAAERGLHEMRERLDLAMHNTEGGVWDWDLARNSIVIDSAWRKTLGYDESEYSSSGLAWVPLVHPHDLELMRNQVAAHLRDEVPYFETQFRIQAKGGGWRWVLARTVSTPRLSTS